MIGIITILLLTILGISIVLLLGLLCIPYSYSGKASYAHGDIFFNFCFSLGGILRLHLIKHLADEQGVYAQIYIFRRKVFQKYQIAKNYDAKDEIKGEKQKNNSDKTKPVKKDRGLHVVKNLELEFIKEVISTAIDIINIVRPKFMRISGKIGFDEPHYTAWVLAVTSSLSPLIKSLTVDVSLVWEEEYLEFDAELAGRFVVFAILWKAIQLMLAKPTRKFWRKTKKKPKYKYSI